MVRQILQPLSTASAVRSRLIFHWQSNSNSSKMERAGGDLKPSKCQFMIKEVEYLGHRISKKGLQLTEEKTQGCSNTQKHFSTEVLSGVVELLHQVAPKYVSEDGPSVPPFPRRRFFGTGKQNRGRLFSRPRKLCPHTLVLTCDASPHAVRVVLSHKTAHGQINLLPMHLIHSLLLNRSILTLKKKHSQLCLE